MQKNLILILLVVGGFTSQMRAEEPGDSLVWEGIYSFYNNETAKAVDILTRGRKEYPLNAVVHLTWASARWLHSQANNPIKEQHKILKDDLDEIIPIYKDLTKKYPNKPLYKLYLGSAEGLRARIHLGNKKWLKALKPAYKGFRTTKSVAENHPEIIDAMLPMGLAEYYAAMRGKLFRMSASLIGLHSTKEVGLQKMEIAANEGIFSWIEARQILAFIYLWDTSDYVKALEHSQILVNHFPNNFYFRLLLTESLIKNSKYEGALNQLNQLDSKILSLTATQITHFKSFLDYEWGLYWFRKGDYDKALNFVNSSIADYGAELDIYLANSLLLQGKIYDIQGMRSEAKLAYKRCMELDNSSSAIRMAKKYRKTAFKL